MITMIKKKKKKKKLQIYITNTVSKNAKNYD